MLSSRTHAAIQTSVSRVLTATCDVRRGTPGARGAMGGETLTWATAKANVPCHVGFMGESDEALVADRLTGRQGYWLRVDKSEDVRIDDRILYGGETFEVVGVRDNVTSDFLRHIVLARLV